VSEQQVSNGAQPAINAAVGALDRWLDTMRGTRGYTGPVANWWRQGFSWTGTVLDWRYEGIITGYIALWRRTGNGHWLAKAQWAGDDLLAGQRPSGHFGYGPAGPGAYVAAVPHGAACAAALLDLALALREARNEGWHTYAAAAELTIHGALLDQLWEPERRVFREDPASDAYVPHQNAAICEALFRHAQLRQETGLLDSHALPALRMIATIQIQRAGDRLDGALPYRVTARREPPRFLPICIARCVPALLEAFDLTGDTRFIEAGWRAFAFLQRCRNQDGSFPATVYLDGRSTQYPRWIAAAGDVLRAGEALSRRGISTDTAPTRAWLLSGQDASGGVATARGLGAQVRQRLPRLPDVRDLRRIPGWCDKAFRALANAATDVTAPASPLYSEQRCMFRGRHLLLCEDEAVVEIRDRSEVRYRWRKSDEWPSICAPEFVIE
jgi:hypothetical protein